MPVRIYTSAPARVLVDDRPFGIVAWSDDPSHRFGEAYVITYSADQKPHQVGILFPLVEVDFLEGIEHAMRTRLEKLWVQTPTARGMPFEQLSEEIPAAEFTVTQLERPQVAALACEIADRTHSADLAATLACFREAESRGAPMGH
jgi:hypothetical protein